MNIIPAATEYAPYYSTYIAKVDGDVLELMSQQTDILSSIVEENEDRLDFAYAEGKWTIRQVIMHIADTEQIFAYRALRIARADQTPLPGFDQNDYIAMTNFDHLNAGDLIRIVENQRANTFSFINGLSKDAYGMTGTASGHKVSVRALIYMMAGHMKHHIDILNERYTS